MTVAQLRAERHVLVDGPSGHVGPKLAPQTLELLDHVALQVGKFSVLPYLVQNSELLAIVPEYLGYTYAASHPVRLLRLLRLSISLEPIDVALYALPERSRTPLSTGLWRSSSGHSPRAESRPKPAPAKGTVPRARRTAPRRAAAHSGFH